MTGSSSGSGAVEPEAGALHDPRQLAFDGGF